MIHQTLAEWSSDPEIHPDLQFLGNAVVELESLKKEYRARVEADISDEELEPWYEAVGQGEKLIKNYAEFYGRPLPENFELIEPEQTVLISIPGIDAKLEGTFDALLRDTRNGLLYVLERKTYKSRPNEKGLQSNDQFLAYIWLASKLGLGEVAGIAYDGMWKREPTSKRALSELFLRKLLIRPPEEVQEFEKFLTFEARDMISFAGKHLARSPAIYLNRRWEGCYDCQFEKLCTAESRGEDSEYVRRTMFKQRESAAAWNSTET